MDRLTKRDEFGISRVCHYPDRDGDALLWNCCYGCTHEVRCTNDIMERLAMYEDLYEVLDDGSLVKLGKARSPTELEEKFNIKSRMHGQTS